MTGRDAEREQLAAALRKHRPRTGCFCRCGWEGDDIAVHQYDALLPVVDRIANERAAAALEAVADDPELAHIVGVETDVGVFPHRIVAVADLYARAAALRASNGEGTTT